jgi:aryl-alcohol dehydrogenase-like predicted oxidoreductase
MNYRKLGKTGLSLSEVSFGAWAIGGGWEINGSGIGYGPTDDHESRQALKRALDHGINLIDTADAYGAGHSEELIGEVLDGSWDGCHVATKVGNERRDPLPGRKNFDPSYIVAACEMSLARLRKDVIDIYQLHNPPPEIAQADDTFEVLQKLRDQGKIRYIGVSITTPEEGVEYIQRGLVDVLQIYYNILTRDAEHKLFPLCETKQIGTLIRAPLKSGILTAKFNRKTTFDSTDHRSGWLRGDLLDRAVYEADAIRDIVTPMPAAEASLRFILNQKAVSTLIPGAKNPKQVDQNVAASDGCGLNTELERAIRHTIPGDFERRT